MLHSFAICLADALGVSETDVILPVVPMFHANAWGLCQAAAMVGSDLVFPGTGMSPAAIAQLIIEHGVTLAAGVPTIWMGTAPLLADRPHRLRMIVSGGSAVPKSLSEQYRREVGLPIIEGWGMTETSPLGSMGRLRSNLAHLSADDRADVRRCRASPSAGRTAHRRPRYWEDSAAGRPDHR